MNNPYLPGVIQIPSAMLITSVTRSYPMIVTYTVPSTGSSTYVPNQVVRFTIPYTWKMFQLNGLNGTILSVDNVNFVMTVDIDSTNFDTFVYNPTSGETPASFAPSGSKNLQYTNFTNQVPFQSLNNIGN